MQAGGQRFESVILHPQKGEDIDILEARNYDRPYGARIGARPGGILKRHRRTKDYIN